MWGYRVLIPGKLRILLLKEVYITHSDIPEIESMTRAFFLWPRLDEDIERFVNSCEVCVSCIHVTCKPDPVLSKSAKWPETVR